VARHHQRTRPVVEEALERAQRVEVEVVGGLVEHQQVRFGGQHHHELQPPPLPARQHLARARTGRWSRTRTARGALGPPSRAGAAGRRRRCGRSPPDRAGSSAVGVARDHGRAPLHRATRRLATPGDHVEQGRLARPVRADHAEPGARFDEQVDVAEHRVVAVRLGHAHQLDHLVAEPRGPDVEQEVAAAHPHRLGAAADDLVRRPQPGLRLGRPRRRTALQPLELAPGEDLPGRLLGAACSWRAARPARYAAYALVPALARCTYPVPRSISTTRPSPRAVVIRSIRWRSWVIITSAAVVPRDAPRATRSPRGRGGSWARRA
jgi:hypothetical protein